eukprot:c25087_g1_i1 orf=251-1804(-)
MAPSAQRPPHISFPSVYECSLEGRESQAVVSDLDGTLLRSNSSFPYYMLMAWEAPAGLARFTALLLLSPMAWLLYTFVSESAAIKLIIWVSFAGVKVTDIKSTAQAVLPKFYAEDVHPGTWQVVSSFGRRYLLTANPRIMVEPFAKQYLGVDEVLGSELEIEPSSRRATGFLRSPGVLVGRNKEVALRRRFGENVPAVGLGDRVSDYPFLAACKEGYIVAPFSTETLLPPAKLSQPLVFHDGRLVSKPTPCFALFILLWLPFGVILSCIRLVACSLLPMSISYYVLRTLGVRLIVDGTPPPCVQKNEAKHGVLLVSTHRTLMDPVVISIAARRPITAVTYSLSRVSEIISPIPTIRLSRDKERDANSIKNLLKQGDLVICPEGTTCREPFLLRFSALFAELADCLVPVATCCHMNMFHATTARGWKGLDSFYFFLNPTPSYKITFLDQLPMNLTCAGGKTSYEVANYVQYILATTLNFKSTKLTRKDKYRALVGNDGDVSSEREGIEEKPNETTHGS